MNQAVFPVATAAAASTVAPVHNVPATLTFTRHQDEKPVLISSAITGGAPKVTFETDRHTVPVADVRPFADSLSIDREGFELLHHDSAVADFSDDAAVEGPYYAETEALLKRRFGASRVVIFDATRRSDGGNGAKNPDGLRGPASRVHVDYTQKSGPQRLIDFIGADEAARLEAAGARILQINVWRPTAGPVRRAPLALADAASIAPRDLLATDQVFPDRVGEIYQLAYDPAQRWYWAPEMDVDEVLLIKGWDSLDDGRARFTPHSAFDLPDQDPTAPPRESIELRTYVIVE